MPLTTQQILDTFYQKNGQYYTSIMAILDNEADTDLVYQTVFDQLDENEIRFVLEDEQSDIPAAFLLYRKQNRLMMTYIFKEADHFEFDLEDCLWDYPDLIELKPKEIAELGVALNHVILDQDLPLEIHGLAKYSPEMLYQSEQDQQVINDRQVVFVKFLAYFLTTGFLAWVIGLALLGRFWFDNEYGLVLGIAIGLLTMSLYLFLGTIYRFRHVYCMHQNLKHEPMTPNDIYWNTIRKKDLYGIPLLFMGLGLVALLLSLLGLMGIIA